LRSLKLLYFIHLISGIIWEKGGVLGPELKAYLGYFPGGLLRGPLTTFLFPPYYLGEGLTLFLRKDWGKGEFYPRKISGLRGFLWAGKVSGKTF